MDHVHRRHNRLLHRRSLSHRRCGRRHHRRLALWVHIALHAPPSLPGVRPSLPPPPPPPPAAVPASCHPTQAGLLDGRLLLVAIELRRMGGAPVRCHRPQLRLTRRALQHGQHVRQLEHGARTRSSAPLEVRCNPSCPTMTGGSRCCVSDAGAAAASGLRWWRRRSQSRLSCMLHEGPEPWTRRSASPASLRPPTGHLPAPSSTGSPSLRRVTPLPPKSRVCPQSYTTHTSATPPLRRRAAPPPPQPPPPLPPTPQPPATRARAACTAVS